MNEPLVPEPLVPEPLVLEPLVLEALEVCRRIDDQWLLHPTDLTVAPGECLVVRGENGSGKSTLLRILAGIAPPTEGAVTYGGRPVDERDPWCRERIASFVDPPGLYPDLTFRDHLDLMASAWRTSGSSQVVDPPEEALARFGIEHLAKRFPHEVSSGQAQLFVLALAFARPGSLLLLDEPEQRLDPDRRAALARCLTERVDAGGSVVLATHSPDLADAVGDLELWLEPA